MSFANFDYEAQKAAPSRSLASATTHENELDLIIDKTSSQLEKFGTLVSQFDTQRKQIGTKRDNVRLRANIDVLVTKISNLESVIRILIENLAAVINKNTKSGGLKISNKQIVIKERLEAEFSGLHKQFLIFKKLYKEKKNLHVLKDGTLNESTPLLDTKQEPQQQQQLQTQQQMDQISETELQYHLLLTQERDQEINQINEGILEINSIFKDLGELVNQQGQQLDTVEENILQLHGHTQQAETELTKANEYQKSKGKWSCIVLVALCVFILVVVLAVIS